MLLFAFVEGAVLLGALTLLPPAVESTGATAAMAGAVTGVYGVAVLLGSRLVGRLSSHWHPAWLIGLGGAGCASLACGLLAISQEPAMAVVVAVLLGLAWTVDALLAADLGDRGAARRPGPTVVSLFAGSLFVGSALAAVAGGRAGRRRALLR